MTPEARSRSASAKAMHVPNANACVKMKDGILKNAPEKLQLEQSLSHALALSDEHVEKKGIGADRAACT